MIWAALGILIVIIYLTVKITSGRSRTEEKSSLPQGNVSVFMDSSGKIDVIPFKLNKFKQGKASHYPLSLKKPYTPEGIGELIRKGLDLSENEKSLTSRELMKSLGFYDWKEYSKGRKSVSVTCTEQEVALNSTIRRKDGSYAFRVRGFERVLPVEISNSELGSEVLKMMNCSV
ncbi:MAG: hypothetical protein GX045_09595 [Clostridiaceae bacterium]|jgi:hypothetical protein|nr:hypothetical protein [Clostridiaceae bacterium]